MTTFWIKGKAGRTPPAKEDVSTTLKIGNKNINCKLLRISMIINGNFFKKFYYIYNFQVFPKDPAEEKAEEAAAE